MQAIYEAILLLPNSPSEATKRLMRLNNNNPDFLFQLKTMAVQLYNRQPPITIQERSQYQTMSKHLVVLFNRFVNILFEKRGKDIYLQIEKIYEWIITILICQKISLTSKKTLQSSLMLVINALTFKADRLVGLLEHIISISLPIASSIFVYFAALLESKVYDSEKIKTIEIIHPHLYYIANFQYQRIIEYYKGVHMENQNQTNIHNLNFAQVLKESQFVLDTIWNLIKFIYQKILQKNQSQNKHLNTLINLLLLDPQLAKYLSSILKIEKDLFASDHQNLFGLKIIVISNLKVDEKRTINRLKSSCLSTLRLILNITDKKFNLQHTDKLLMKELPILANLILQQLIICSKPTVMQSLSQQIQASRIIACMFELLAQIVLFHDLKKGFERLKIEQIIRLTLPYMKTYQEETTIYNEDPDDYFALVTYICNPQIEQENDLQIGDLFLKKNVAVFLKKISRIVEGFYSILMEIVLDIIRLENECRPSRNREYEKMFLQKYNLQPTIFQCFDLQSTLLTFTVLITSSDSQLENRKRIKTLLQTINLRQLKQLQLCRVYTCLSKTSFFNLPEIQVKYYHYIENAFTLDRMSASLNKITFHFIESLLTGNLDPDRNYLFFMEKVIDESLSVLEYNNKPFIYSMLNSVVNFDKARKYIFNLNLINRFLQKINFKIKTQYNNRNLDEDLMTTIFMLYLSIIKLASELIEANTQHPYPEFHENLAYYQQLASQLASPTILATHISLIKQEIINEVQIQLIYYHCTLILHLLRSNFAINEQIMTQICDFAMLLLLNDRRCFQFSNMQIKYNTLNNITFHLIYQIINARMFSLNQEQHKTILQWMNAAYYRSQTLLNQVCILLQQFYYLISGNIFRSQQLLTFFSGIAEKLQKKFFQILFKLSNYMAVVEQQLDEDRKKIHELKIQFETDVTVKYEPATVCRLYGTVLLNPNFDVKLISKIYQPMRKYMFELLPVYDLTIQTLGLQFLVSRSQNIGVAECFRFTTELLYYNTKHSQSTNSQKNSNKFIRMMSSELKSSIASLDPYQIYCDIIDRLIRQRETYLNDYSKPLQQFEIDLIDFIKTDKYMEDVVRRLTLVRRVNEQPRTILRIKRSQ